jgi:hypothetical protein
MSIFNKKKSTDMSLPQAMRIHGIEIKKVPVGQYIKAMKEMEDLPRLLVEECFPGKSIADIIAILTSTDQAMLMALIGRLIIVLPSHIVEALCSIVGIPIETAMENLTPKELKDVVKDFWKLNDLTDFFGSVWELIKAKLPTLISGSSVGSLLPRTSASAKTAS